MITKEKKMFPLYDKIVVRILEKDQEKKITKNKDGVIVSNHPDRDLANTVQGIVVAIGPGRRNEFSQENSFIPPFVDIGNTILFEEKVAQKIKVGESLYYILHEESAHMVLE